MKALNDQRETAMLLALRSSRDEFVTMIAAYYHDLIDGLQGKEA